MVEYVNGMWRSWLARTAGGREVAGSSPVIPTIFSNNKKASDDPELYLIEKPKMDILITNPSANWILDFHRICLADNHNTVASRYIITHL